MTNNLTVQPLKFPFDWNRLSSLQKVLLWFPLFGPQVSARRSIIRQLKRRTVNDLKMWDDFSSDEKRIARIVSGIIQNQFSYPNDLFMPNDPFEIMIWDSLGDLGTTEVVSDIEEKLALKRKDSGEWESLAREDFGTVVSMLLRAKS